ncbi:mycofactocin precursor MftA [Streptomyces gilvus]|nr:mycofactocin precursor MftA [Streptomyces sp. CME 23]MCH5676605.1 mycofactocin precursor MftA [Streptomyces sp. CME 23]
MDESTSTTTEHHSADEIAPPDPLIEADALVEEVSIDGMCGVY